MNAAAEPQHQAEFELLEMLTPLEQGRADELYQQLTTDINWQNEYIAFGRAFPVPRRQCWVADKGIHYRVANNFLHSNPWSPLLLDLRQEMEDRCGHPFNSVLLTWYRDGADSVNWHRDNEPELGEQPYIASLSLGATRCFHYRHRQSHQQYGINLGHGDVCLMHPQFQQEYDHAVFVEPQVNAGRINLTFRYVHPTMSTNKLDL